MYAGRKTAETMLSTWQQVAYTEDEEVTWKEDPSRSLTEN